MYAYKASKVRLSVLLLKRVLMVHGLPFIEIIFEAPPPHTHTHTRPHTLMWHCYKSGGPSNNQNIHEWVLWNTNCEYKYLRKMCVIYSRTAWKGERRQESRVMGKLIAQIFEAWSDLFRELTLNSPTPSPITPAVIRRATHPPTQAGQEYILRTSHIRKK